MIIGINGHTFTLLPEKALYKNDERLLIIADVHLGKANHFRKEGISIPARAQQGDYTNLEQLFIKIKPLKVYFLGDLFHSTYNRDWLHFCNLVAQFPGITFSLIRGNHDLIDHQKFNEICIDVVDSIEDSCFIYSHEPLERKSRGKVNITGHIHPGIVLSGLGRQSLKLPCFYITPSVVVVPAFGILTGLYSMERTLEADIYAVLPGQVAKV